MDPKDYDYLDIGTRPLKGGSGARPNWGGLLLALAAALGCAAMAYWALRPARGSSSAASVSPAAGPAGPDDWTKRRLTSCVEDFLPAYYNFSCGLYDQSVERAETMMTPDFQAAYNQRAEDLDFKRKLVALQVRTDAIKILPGSLAFAQDGPVYYVRLAGTMTYTTGVNGATGDFPLTLLLALRRSGDGFLVDNVERLR